MTDTQNKELINIEYYSLTFAQKIDKAFLYGSLRATNKLLQDPEFDPSNFDSFAICTASEYGHVRVVDRLLQDSRIDPSIYNNYALVLAAMNGHLAVIERLLQDSRVNISELHYGEVHNSISINQFSDKSLSILANTLKFPFKHNSYIIDWEPRLLEYIRDFNSMIDERTVYSNNNTNGIHRDIWEYVVKSYLE
jgi:hypothetical protein